MNTEKKIFIASLIALFTIFALIFASNYTLSSSNSVLSNSSNSDIEINESIVNDSAEYLELGGLKFYTSLDIGLQEAQKQKKPLFIYIRAVWCGWCKKFESETFNNETAINLLNENFILTTIDIDEQRDLAVNLGARGTPTSIFVAPNKIEIRGTRIPGYVSTDKFIQILNIILKKNKIGEMQ
ncbi:MAG: thioredoxin family protein [Methanosarcinales archaeon]